VKFLPPPADATLGRTNYVGVAGMFGRGTDPLTSPYEGLFTNRSQNSLARVPDGTSYTLLFGEALGGVQDGVRLYDSSWMGHGVSSTARGLHADHNSSHQPFDSMHPGIVQFCLADGHVRGLKKGVAYWDFIRPIPPRTPEWATFWAFQELGGFRDGGVRDNSAIMP
jgi:hypothetical protein